MQAADKFIVIGAGMAGLLAAGMLRDDCARVVEAKNSLPDNHSAVLRFKSSIVGDALNIPFKKVKALKAVHPWKNPLADAMAYSKKTNGSYSIRSITSANGELVERYIAPPDLLKRMLASVKASIGFGVEVKRPYFDSLVHPFISTMPMPVLMDLLGWDEKPDFKFLEGVTISATLKDCDLYCSLYIPDPSLRPYRVSITGDKVMVEVIFDEELKADFEPADSLRYFDQAMKTLGLPVGEERLIEFKRQRYMKLLPIEESVRQRFIMWASDTHKVYSLGRFATWRPGLLLDDLVNDVRTIQKIHASSNYAHRSKA